MLYKNIAIIGVGTLGGFIANSLMSLESLERLTLIDHDIVERKNLVNSIYRPIDIGGSKVEALKDILDEKNTDVTIWAFDTKYEEGKSKFPKHDLIIDCRDHTYNREKEIDCRIYISSRYLIVDCRKNVSYNELKEGKYIIQLTKEDLKYAGSIVSMLVHTNTISTLIKNQFVQKYELDYVKHIDVKTCDIVYENIQNRENFINLPDKIMPIIELNKNSDMNVYFGSKSFPLSQSLIPKGSLKDTNDIINSFGSITKLQCDYHNFIISVVTEGQNVYVELIPETGAA